MKVLFYTILALFFSCKSTSQNPLVGKWCSDSFYKAYGDYREDGTYNAYRFGKINELITGFQGYDSLELFQEGFQKYEITKFKSKKDFEYITYTIVSKDTLNKTKYFASFLTPNELLAYRNKTGKYKHHVSNASLKRRYTQDLRTPDFYVPESEVSMKMVLPIDFEGYLAVLYNDSVAMKNTSNKFEFIVPESGLLKTNLTINLEVYTRNLFGIYQQGKRLNLVSRAVLDQQMIKLETTQAYINKFDGNETVAIKMGINRFARDLYYKKYGEHLHGNIILFYIGKLNDIKGSYPKF